MTHSLIGAALGSALSRKVPQKKRAMVWATVVASNFPDIDFLLPNARADGRLGYLLHHRGYTHTVPIALVLGLVIGGFFSRIFRADKRAASWIIFSSILGILFHLVADFWNEYGIHPFFPMNNRWIYGDFIFILEPLLWLSLMPFVFSESTTRAAKAVLLIAGLGVISYAALGSQTIWPVALAIALFGLFSCAVHWRFRKGQPALVLFLGILLIFFAGSRSARLQIEAQYAKNSEIILQLATSPAPANPLCWKTVVASSSGKGDYRARLGVLSLSPEVISAERCFPDFSGFSIIAPLQTATLSDTDHLKWLGEFQGKFSDLVALKKRSCGFSALLQFARIPFWVVQENHVYSGDLRFFRPGRIGFSQMSFLLDQPQSCPQYPAPWAPPLSTE